MDERNHIYIPFTPTHNLPHQGAVLLPVFLSGILLPIILQSAKMAVELRNTIKEKMERGEVAYTLSVKTVRTIEISMMAKTAGFDGILIDMEHSSFDL